MASEDAPMLIRLCEWGHKRVSNFPETAIEVLTTAAQAWRQDNRLNVAPLSINRLGGDTVEIHAKQFVGVIEAHDYTIEIFPKLDSHLLDAPNVPESTDTTSVMQSLLWMLDASGHESIVDADAAALEELPSRFLDLFTLLFAKQLRQTLLSNGLARRYEIVDNDSPGVRGRVQIGRQVSQNWNRLDKIACIWDEFTSDTAVNRLLRCACRTLAPRVRHRDAAWLLSDCTAMMEDVSDTSPDVALRETRNLRAFDCGAWAAFRRPFLLGRRLLSGFGHHLGSGSADTFVFLLDMNQVFESYARAALEARFQVAVDTQHHIGRLLHGNPHRILQKPDFVWQVDGQNWIGDAKYKHLTKGHDRVLRFEDLPADETDGPYAAGAARMLSPNDVRQLTVYAELQHRAPGRAASDRVASLALIYPFIGSESVVEAPKEVAWNGSILHLIPLLVRRVPQLADAMPVRL